MWRGGLGLGGEALFFFHIEKDAESGEQRRRYIRQATKEVIKKSVKDERCAIGTFTS